MNYEKQKIKVHRDPRHYGPEPWLEVEAILVGGPEGVFAVWDEGHLVHMAKGDDGFWKEMCAYDKHWINDILCAIGVATNKIGKYEKST